MARAPKQAKTATKPKAEKKTKTVKKPTVKKTKGIAELSRSSIPMNFVKKNEGTWDHAKWLEFLDKVKEKGYVVDDVDQIGLLLEAKKEQYFAQ